MPVGGETLIAGPYVGTWNSVALGIFAGDGGLPTLEFASTSEPIGNTSAYGKTVIDEIYQGVNPTMSMTCEEYKAGPIAAFWPYHATLWRLGTIGVLMYTLAQALVLTAVTGTSASASPASFTASKTILLPGFATRLVYGPTLRTVPLRFRLYPFDSAGAVVFATQT